MLDEIEGCCDSEVERGCASADAVDRGREAAFYVLAQQGGSAFATAE